MNIALYAEDPGESFQYDAGQTRYTEQINYVLLRNLKNLSDEGATLSFETASELSSLKGAFESVETTLLGLVDTVIGGGTISANDVPALPSPTDLDLLKAGSWKELAIQIAIRIGIYHIQKYIGKWISTEEESPDLDLTELIQAIQDLKYNDEILEIPATPRPIRIHLQSKTIQQ